MKRTLTLLVLAMFSASLAACHASVDTDDTNGKSSHYEKKTTTSGDGTKTTRMETKTSNP